MEFTILFFITPFSADPKHFYLLSRSIQMTALFTKTVILILLNPAVIIAAIYCIKTEKS